MNLLAVVGSPRKGGNTDLLLDELIEGARSAGKHEIDKVYVCDLNVKPCIGCLRCNVLGRCAQKRDDWHSFAERFAEADAVAFGSPIYFHHVTAQLKAVLDRFRSLVHVRMTPQGLVYSSRITKPKRFALVLVMGGSVESEASPIVEVFEFLSEVSGGGGKLVGWIVGKGLAVPGQVKMGRDALTSLYAKLGLPLECVEAAIEYNASLCMKARELGRKLVVEE